MNHGDGSVRALAFLHEQKRKPLSHHNAAAQHYDTRTRDVELAFDEQSLHAERCARDEPARVVERELGHILRMKTVDIFVWIESAHDFSLVDLFWRRRLHENSVDCRVVIEFLRAREQFCLRCRFRQLDFYGMQSKL